MKWPRRAAREEPRTDMTPMIDVVFQIIIFFLCTLQYRTLEGRLDAFLPRGAGKAGDATKLEPLDVVIQVLDPGQRCDPARSERAWSGRGRFEYAGRRLAYRVGPRQVRGLAGLHAVLGELHGLDPERGVRIDARAGTVQGDVLGVLDAVIEAGFGEVMFAAPR